MSKINLIPEVKQEKNKISKINTSVTTVASIAGVSLVIAIVVLSGYAGVLAAQKASLGGDITKVKESLKTMSAFEKTVTDLEVGLSNIKNIVSGNKDWNTLFGTIEKTTPNDIQFVSLSIKGNTANANITGKNVTSIDRYLQSFSSAKSSSGDSYFTDVVVSGYTLDDSGKTSFTSTFNINEKAVWEK